MKIKNVSSSIAIIDDKMVGGLSLTLYPTQEVTVFNEDAEKSPTLKVYIDNGYILQTGNEEPSSVGELFTSDDTKKVMTFTGNLHMVSAVRPVEDYAYLFKVEDGAGMMKGLINQKTYAIGVVVSRPLGSGATLDSNDAILKGSFNNYAVNDANYIVRGINVGLNNRSGGVVGMMDNNLGCQGKSGGTCGTIRGLTLVPENYGTVTDEFSGLAIEMKNEGAVATLEYGIRIRNLNNSLATKVTSAILVADSGVNTGFTTGLNLNGATLTNEIVFSNGIKLTVSGDTVVLTNAGATASTTLNLASGGGAFALDSTVVHKTGDTMTDTLICYKDNASSFRLSGKDFGGTVRQTYAGVFYNDQFDSTGLGTLKTRMIQGGNEFMDVEIQSSHAILLSAQDIAFHDGFVKIGANKYVDFHCQADGDTIAVQQLRITRKDEATFGNANVSAVEIQSIAAAPAVALPLEINTTSGAGLTIGGPLGFVGGTTITVTGSVIVFQNGAKTGTMDLVAGTLVFA